MNLATAATDASGGWHRIRIGERAEVRAKVNASFDALILRTFQRSPSSNDPADWSEVGTAVIVPRDQLPTFLTILEGLGRELR